MTATWKWPSNSRKAHAFVDGRSLCGKWGDLLVPPVPNQAIGTEPGPDDCKACWRKHQKLAGEGGTPS